MVEKVDGFSKASKIFEFEKHNLIVEEKYKSVETLLDSSRGLASKTTKICDAYGSGIIALGITDLIAAKVEDSDKVFDRMLSFFKENGITTDVQTESLRYRSAICLGIYLERQIGNG